MVVALSGPIFGTYDPSIVDASGGFNLYKQAENAYPPAVNAVGNRPVTFVAELTCLGNEAMTVVGLQPFNLTALGVLFPVGTLRNIRTRCWSKRSTAILAGFVEKVFTVQGGAPPTLQTASSAAQSIDNAANDARCPIQVTNNAGGATPEYAHGHLALDGANIIVGVQNFLGTTGALTVTAGIRCRLEVLIDPLVTLPVFV